MDPGGDLSGRGGRGRRAVYVRAIYAYIGVVSGVNVDIYGIFGVSGIHKYMECPSQGGEL